MKVTLQRVQQLSHMPVGTSTARDSAWIKGTEFTHVNSLNSLHDILLTYYKCPLTDSISFSWSPAFVPLWHSYIHEYRQTSVDLDQSGIEDRVASKDRCDCVLCFVNMLCAFSTEGNISLPSRSAMKIKYCGC